MNNAKVVEREAARQFMSVADAAKLLSVSEVRVRRLLGQKKLKRFKVGSRTLLDRADVLGFAREG
jgi:excisionase family DNA binding protein